MVRERRAYDPFARRGCLCETQHICESRQLANRTRTTHEPIRDDHVQPHHTPFHPLSSMVRAVCPSLSLSGPDLSLAAANPVSASVWFFGAVLTTLIPSFLSHALPPFPPRHPRFVLDLFLRCSKTKNKHPKNKNRKPENENKKKNPGTALCRNCTRPPHRKQVR